MLGKLRNFLQAVLEVYLIGDARIVPFPLSRLSCLKQIGFRVFSSPLFGSIGSSRLPRHSRGTTRHIGSTAGCSLILGALFATIHKQHFTHAAQALCIDIAPLGAGVSIIKTQGMSCIARRGVTENWSREVYTKSLNITISTSNYKPAGRNGYLVQRAGVGTFKQV